MKKSPYTIALLAALTVSTLSHAQSDNTEKYQAPSAGTDSGQYAEQKYDAPAEAASNPWFTGGISNFSLDKLSLLLPSFIQVTPESQILGDVKWNIESFSQVSVNADATLTSVTVNHRGLADEPIRISDLQVKGTIRWNRSDKTLSFQDLYIGRKGVLAKLNGRVNYKDKTAVNLNVFLPETELQGVIDAIPSGLIPRLSGAQVGGTIALNTIFSADPAKPQELRFEPGITIQNYALLQEPARLNIGALKDPIIYEVKRNGQIVRSILLSADNPQFVPYSQLGDPLRMAILKAEDVSFFTHNGFNLEEMRKAMRQNLTAGRYARGGSTISMQLAKNLYLDGRKTLSRKIQEAMLTYALEEALTKERMFEIYANIIEWGVDVYGVHEATNHYFSKPSAELTPQEAAFLASIIPNPKKRDTLHKTTPEATVADGSLLPGSIQ